MNSKEQNTRPVPAPRLRFPGFDGAWEEKKLGEMADLTAGATPSTTEKAFWGGEIPWMSSGDIHKKRVWDVEGRITELGLKSSSTKMLPANSVLVALAGQGKTRGTVATNAIELCTNQSIAAISPKPGLNYEYLFANLDSRYDELRSLSTGEGGRGGLNLGILRTVEIPLPPTLPEQARIAAALSSLDAVIEAHQSNQDALREHKQGLMAGLFPAEDERVPRLRFPEFEGAREWEEKKLGEIIKNIASGKSKSDAYGLYRLYGSTGIIGQTNDNDYSGKFINVARVGANAGFTQLVSGEFGATDNTLVISLYDEYSYEFIFAYLNFFDLNKLVFGSGQPLITGKSLKNLSVTLPSFAEQTRIAAALSSLDDLITAQGDKIAALQEFKRGLMQGLFPADRSEE